MQAWAERIDDALRESMGEGEMVVRWVACIEYIDAEGSRGLYSIGSPNLESWDAIGMLRTALIRQEAAEAQESLSADSED